MQTNDVIEGSGHCCPRSNEHLYDGDRPSLTAQLCSHDVPEWRLRLSKIAPLRGIPMQSRRKTAQRVAKFHRVGGQIDQTDEFERKKERKLRVTCRLGKGCCRHNPLASHRPAAAETRQEPTLSRRAHHQSFAPDASSCRAVT
jgi:hypothetical protein